MDSTGRGIAVPPRLRSLQAHELPEGMRLAVAAGLGSRTVGLAGLREPPRGWGLLIPRCRSVHTFGMRFALDLLFLGRTHGVVEVRRGLPPRRLATCPGAVSVLEVSAGEADLFAAALAATPWNGIPG